jgi:hypothetical protein
MGIGEKQVAHGWDSATMKIPNGQLQTSLTRQQIADAPAYKMPDRIDENGGEGSNGY